MPPRAAGLLSGLLVAFLWPLPATGAFHVVASRDGATVEYDDLARTWAIGNDLVRFTVGLDSVQTYRVLQLTNQRTGHAWIAGTDADVRVWVAGKRIGFGAQDALLRFHHDESIESETGVELRVVFEIRARKVRVTRHYACYRQAPVIEMWTTFEALAGAPGTALNDLNAWQLLLARGTIHYVNGQQRGPEDGGPFTLQTRNLAAGQGLEIHSPNRASEVALPWFSLESGAEQFFGGVMWAGAWSLEIAPLGSAYTCAMGLDAPMSTELRQGRAVEAPHGFIGVGSVVGMPAAAGMQAFIVQGVRGGRGFAPRVTYNTWYGHGVMVDDDTIRREMAHAAALGAERFVVDAGWYPGSGALDWADFTSGLGRWTADTTRFPVGLSSLSAFAHSLGMEFGIWVEPERVSLETVFVDEAVDEGWLARRDGRYDPAQTNADAVAGQICLADADARTWVLDRLSALIDESQADYIKWDNNFWVNCNREGHGHGAQDGNFAHVTGLYALLAALRERYPNLVIENCASGGNRLDIGLMKYTDVAWMDDQTAPSVHVRHNLEGLSTVFPPAYLLSFVLGADVDPLHLADDLPLLFRSRMPGVLGLAFSSGVLTEGEEATAAREIALYKELRDIQRDAGTWFQAGQAEATDDPWEVLEQVSAGSGSAIIFAFDGDVEAAEATNVRPRGLRPDATYQVRSADLGILGTRTGAELMEEGIDIGVSSTSAGHILVLTVMPDEADAAQPAAASKKVIPLAAVPR